MNKLISVILCLFMSGCSDISGHISNTDSTLINGKEENLSIYTINDSSCSNIYDLAYYMDFHIEYDGENDSILIDTDKKYDGKKPEIEDLSEISSATKSSQKVYVNGIKENGIDIYTANGINYYEISDIARTLDFGYRYNYAKDRIELSNAFDYNSAGIFGRQKDDDILKITYIDVGQGDSALIEFPDNAGEMLIDAGTSDCAEHLVSYLNEELPDNKLEYVVATHPHADHIGSMKTVVENYKIDNFYNSKNSHTTKTYKNMIAAAEQKGILRNFEIGETVNVTDSVSFTFLAPVKGYDDLNDSSTVIRIDYEDTSFLFTGDCQSQAESDMIDAGVNLSADVVKVAHHGSKTSSSNNFIKNTGAKYAVASLALENEYNHPSHDVINRWQQRGTTFLATSVLSDIIITSDGEEIRAYPDEDYEF